MRTLSLVGMLVAAVTLLPGIREAAAAEVSRIDIPLTVKSASALFVDADAAKGSCIAGDLSNKNGSLAAVPVPAAKPGVYRLHARLKMSHTCIPATARLEYTLQLAAGGKSLAARELSIVDFERPARYQEFVLPLTVTDGVGDMVFGVQWRWPEGPIGQKVQLRKFDKSDLPSLDAATELAPDAKAADAAQLKIERPLSELKYHLALDALWLEPLGDVAVSALHIDKARYRPGDNAAVSGTIANHGAGTRSLSLRLEMLCALGEAAVVSTTPYTVPPGGEVTFKAVVPIGDRLWDREFRAILLDANGNELTRTADVRTVHTNPWAVALPTQNMDLTEYRAQGYLPKLGQPLEGRERYTNAIEFVFWAPDDFGDLTPSGRFYSGQTRRDNGEESTRKLIAFFHTRGVACSMYGKIDIGSGKAGYDLLRRHPDWSDPDFYDVAQLDRWDRSKSLSIYPQLVARRDTDEPYKHHASELIASHSQFGWDSVRYDSAMNWPEMARHLKLVHDLVNAACPGFQWGYNSGHPDNYAPGIFDEMCARGGMIMEEANVHAFKDGWTYDKYAGRHLEFRSQVHRRGGHLTFCPGEPEGYNDLTYQQILVLCARAHHAWNPASHITWGADYTRFCARYPGQLWDNTATPVPQADKVISWGAAAPKLFKWAAYSYLRALGGDKSELILHLVNQPPERVCGYDDCRVPEPLESIEGRITLPQGLTATAAWRLSAELDPEQLSLPLRQEKGQVVVTVPKLRFWNMIVLQLTGAGRWQ